MKYRGQLVPCKVCGKKFRSCGVHNRMCKKCFAKDDRVSLVASSQADRDAYELHTTKVDDRRLNEYID